MVLLRFTRNIGDELFTANLDLTFPPGQLPVGKRIVETMMALLRPNEAGKSYRTISEASRYVALLLMEHWEFCNIYTISYVSIVKKIETLYNKFKELSQWRKQ